MKSIKTFILLPALAFGLQYTLLAQTDEVNEDHPSNQFSLQGALEMFKLSSSPENFEERLNTEDNMVNNLDLDRDGEVDYIRVIDRHQGDLHVLTLQVPVNDKENQDIAVIEIEKTGNEEAIVQIIGDEDIYGKQIIVEPAGGKAHDDVFVQDESVRGPNAGFGTAAPSGIIVNVWFWPSVRFVFRPGYVVWVSPYRWGRRPVWFHPWRPIPRHSFYSHQKRYHPRYVVINVHRVSRADHFYRPYRSYSPSVRSYRQSRYDRNRRQDNRRYRSDGNNRRSNDHRPNRNGGSRPGRR